MRSEDHYFFSQLSPEPRWNCTETRVAPVCPPGNGEQKYGVKGGFTPLTIDQFFLSPLRTSQVADRSSIEYT